MPYEPAATAFFTLCISGYAIATSTCPCPTEYVSFHIHIQKCMRPHCHVNGYFWVRILHPPICICIIVTRKRTYLKTLFLLEFLKTLFSCCLLGGEDAFFKTVMSKRAKSHSEFDSFIQDGRGMRVDCLVSKSSRMFKVPCWSLSFALTIRRWVTNL